MTATYANARPLAVIRRRRTLVALVLFATAAVLLYATLAALAWPTRAVVWGGLAFAAYAIGFLFLIGDRQGRGLGLVRWQFGAWILAWWSVSFGLATVTWSQSQTGTVAGQIALSSVLRALWLVAVGMTAWVLGYLAGPGQPTRRLAARGVGALGRRFAAEVRSPAAPWFLYAIGSAARIAGTVTSGRFGYIGNASLAVSTASSYGQILSGLSLCAPLAVSAAALQVYRERLPGARATLIVLLLIEIAVSVVSGDKQAFLIALVAVLVPYCAVRCRLPKVALVPAVIAFLVVIVPFNAAYRSSVRPNQTTLTTGQALDAAPGIFRQTVTGPNLLAILPNSAGYLLGRVREIDGPAIILQRTPGQIGFLSPAQLITVPLLGWVPREIWHSKPIMVSGYQFSQQYYGSPSTVYTSSAITPIGDLYRHGGWIPVIAGMLVLGCGVRLLDNVTDIRANPHAILLVVLLFPSLVKNESDWPTLLVGILSTMLIWLLAVALTFRPRRSK